MFDAIIVGGGPAGLSAALVLGRCRRRVCLFDSGHPRNERAHGAHAVFTRDGTPPHELRRLGRSQLEPYDVTIHDDEVTTIERQEDSFVARTRGGLVVEGRRLLLATGMRDKIPDRPGFAELFGKGVYVCPYCDGWENRDRRLAAYAPADCAADTALALLTWSRDVVLFTAGEKKIDDSDRARLARNGIPVVDEADIASLEGNHGKLGAVILTSGARIERDALFLHLGEEQAAPFAERLGCEITENGTVRTGKGERAGGPGVFVAGDASHDLQLVPIALAEGVKAACAINTELRKLSQR